MTNKYLVFTMALVSFLEDHSKTFQWSWFIIFFLQTFCFWTIGIWGSANQIELLALAPTSSFGFTQKSPIPIKFTKVESLFQFVQVGSEKKMSL